MPENEISTRLYKIGKTRTPSHFAAARLTIGVSSDARAAKALRISSFIDGETFAYTGEYRAAEEVRDVNHSPPDKRVKRGI